MISLRCFPRLHLATLFTLAMDDPNIGFEHTPSTGGTFTTIDFTAGHDNPGSEVISTNEATPMEIWRDCRRIANQNKKGGKGPQGPRHRKDKKQTQDATSHQHKTAASVHKAAAVTPAARRGRNGPSASGHLDGNGHPSQHVRRTYMTDSWEEQREGEVAFSWSKGGKLNELPRMPKGLDVKPRAY